MKKSMICIAVVLPIILGCEKSDLHSGGKAVLNGTYPVSETFGKEARIFGPSLISTPGQERDCAVSPEGDRICFSVKYGSRYGIAEVRKEKDRWLEPEIASFSGVYSDFEPCFSPD